MNAETRIGEQLKLADLEAGKIEFLDEDFDFKLSPVSVFTCLTSLPVTKSPDSIKNHYISAF